MASPIRGRPRRHALNQQAFATSQGRRKAQPSKIAPQDERYERARLDLGYPLINFIPRWS